MTQLSLFELSMNTPPAIAATAEELNNRVRFMKNRKMIPALKERYYELEKAQRPVDALYLLQEFVLD